MDSLHTRNSGREAATQRGRDAAFYARLHGQDRATVRAQAQAGWAQEPWPGDWQAGYESVWELAPNACAMAWIIRQAGRTLDREAPDALDPALAVALMRALDALSAAVALVEGATGHAPAPLPSGPPI